MTARSRAWRGLFALAGGLIAIGGANHPGGTMSEMLAHADWVWSHALMAAGFAVLVAGLALYRRTVELDSVTDRWCRWAVIGAVLQTAEMVAHTGAAVDAVAYAAGGATPVYWIHVAMTILFNPLFAALMAGLIFVGSRRRVLTSPLIAWLGIGGAVAHGLAPILVVVLGLSEFRFLFPMLLLLALWLVAAAVWPARGAASDRSRRATPD